jgi:hypothetical protein
MTTWQFIETAPFKTRILVSDGKEIYLCTFEPMNTGFLILPYGFSGHDCEADFFSYELTHWMPLPEPPK